MSLGPRVNAVAGWGRISQHVEPWSATRWAFVVPPRSLAASAPPSSMGPVNNRLHVTAEGPESEVARRPTVPSGPPNVAVHRARMSRRPEPASLLLPGIRPVQQPSCAQAAPRGGAPFCRLWLRQKNTPPETPDRPAVPSTNLVPGYSSRPPWGGNYFFILPLWEAKNYNEPQST